MRWSEKQIEDLIALYPQPRFTATVIAKVLGKCERTVLTKARRLGLSRPAVEREVSHWQKMLNEKSAAVDRHLGWVYLMRGKGTRSYKIGFTKRDIDRRLREMNLASAVPVELLGMVRGSFRDEAQYHERFRELHCHGEWFVLPDEITTPLLAEFQKLMEGFT